jgi:hypothetical protein
MGARLARLRMQAALPVTQAGVFFSAAPRGRDQPAVWRAEGKGDFKVLAVESKGDAKRATEPKVSGVVVDLLGLLRNLSRDAAGDDAPIRAKPVLDILAAQLTSQAFVFPLHPRCPLGVKLDALNVDGRPRSCSLCQDHFTLAPRPCAICRSASSAFELPTRQVRLLIDSKTPKADSTPVVPAEAVLTVFCEDGLLAVFGSSSEVGEPVYAPFDRMSFSWCDGCYSLQLSDASLIRGRLCCGVRLGRLRIEEELLAETKAPASAPALLSFSFGSATFPTAVKLRLLTTAYSTKDLFVLMDGVSLPFVARAGWVSVTITRDDFAPLKREGLPPLRTELKVHVRTDKGQVSDVATACRLL